MFFPALKALNSPIAAAMKSPVEQKASEAQKTTMMVMPATVQAGRGVAARVRMES